ncbi:MAG: hypothetical protein HY884_04690 [Deltaproteobacteria bacterium]|nr:hypothetical protein [Deltaproteobacteria bacterium]
MRKIQIIGPKSFLDECIKTLHATSVVHIEAAQFESAGKPGMEEPFFQRLLMEKDKLKEKEALDRAAERIKNLLFLLKPPQTSVTVYVSAEDLPRLMGELAAVEEKVKTLYATVESLREEFATVVKYERLVMGFAPVMSRLGGLKSFEIAGLTIEKARGYATGLLDAEVSRITAGRYEIHVIEIDAETTGIVLAYPREFGGQIRHLLSGKAINELRLPDEYSDMPFLHALELMGRKKAELPNLIRDAEKEIAAISNNWFERLRALKNAVEDSLDEIGAFTYAGQTRFAFVMEGWAPADRLHDLKERFLSLFEGSVLLREIEIKEGERGRIPIYIENPVYLRPFEVFLSALTPPRYDSVDPTPFVAIFFPVFFGLMVADIGYGVIIFSLCLFLRARFKDNRMMRDVFTVICISSVPAVVFGFLFGEFFGDLGVRLGLLHPLILRRAEALKAMMALTLGVGAGHVMLGVIIGVVNHLRRNKLKEAGARFAYLLTIMAVILIVVTVFGGLPKAVMLPAVGLLVISLAAFTALEGAIGPIEFVKAIGNMLSYVRIMAIGTASVVMAIVANKIGGIAENIAIGILVAGALHALNIILSMVSPVIQSMRLQYVEFFSKFYEGGGRRYAPFRKR